MTRKAKAFIAVVACVGLATVILCVSRFITQVQQVPFSKYGPRLLLLTGLCAVCRSFPVTIRKNQGLDLSVIAVLAAFLMDGMEAAMVVYLLSSLATFEQQDDGKLHSIYNISPVKTLFNTGDIMLAILVPGLVCRWLNWRPGDLSVPLVLAPTLIFAVLAFAFNFSILLALFYLNGDISLREAGRAMLGVTVNVVAAMPLGLILALTLSQPMGIWLALLLICPLMLARYTWKLYLDARRRKEALIGAFVTAMEARDPYTQGHSERVGEYAVRIARRMSLPDQEIDSIREGALLHDIGKIGVSDQILHKPGSLDASEWEQMKRHPVIGAQIVEKVGVPPDVMEMIRSHHERCDAKGYPDGTSSMALSTATRILGVADAFDAMTSDRPYRRGMTVAQALAELERGAGTQFDADVVSAMSSLMAEEAVS